MIKLKDILSEGKVYTTQQLKDIDWEEGKGAAGNMFSMTMWIDFENTHDVSVNKRGVWNWIEEFEKKFGKTKWETTTKKGYELIPVGNSKLDKHMKNVVAKIKSPNKDTLGLTSPYGNKLSKWS